MTPATNRAARELPEPPVRPHLTLLDGRVKDSVLVGRALAGGPRGKAAEEELFRRYRPAVSRLAASFSELDPDEADDVVQEAFVRCFRALASLKDRDRFAAWRSEEHTSELQSRLHLVCRLLLEKKKKR